MLLPSFLQGTTSSPYSCRLEPEETRVPVPDERFDWLCQTYKPKSEVAPFLTCIDIAGLTAGASSGAGLGNAFLSHVRAVDGIFQVIRCFDDAEVIHVEGEVDPIRDMEIIQTELRLKDIEWTQKKLETLKKGFRGTGTANLADKAKKEEIVRLTSRRLPDDSEAHHSYHRTPLRRLSSACLRRTWTCGKRHGTPRRSVLSFLL